MEENTNLLIIIAAIVVNLLVFYFLIQFAVKSATKEILNNLDLLTKLKIEEMKKEGHTKEVQKVLTYITELRQLEQQKKDGYINGQQFSEKKKHLTLSAFEYTNN